MLMEIIIFVMFSIKFAHLMKQGFVELYTQRIKERNLGSIRLRPHKQKLHRLRSPELRLSRLRLRGLKPSRLCPIG